MSKPIKVYNKGTRPVVFKRGRLGTDAIHPLKFKTFHAKMGAAIIHQFKDACSEEDFKKFLAEAANKIKEEHEKHLKEMAKKQTDNQKKTEIEKKKETGETVKK